MNESDAKEYRLLKESRYELVNEILIGLVVVVVVLGIVWGIIYGVTENNKKNAKLASECIQSGGTWIYKSCIRSPGR